jgi:hemerythrin
MALTWIVDWNTGIEVIDDQHKRIVDYINSLEKAITEQQHAMVGTILDALVEYTQSHFSFEENLLTEAEYELVVPHKAMHDMFIKRVSKYQAQHHAGEDIARQLYTMLSVWLTHHIKSDDRGYVEIVRNNIERRTQHPEDAGWLKRSLRRFFG